MNKALPRVSPWVHHDEWEFISNMITEFVYQFKDDHMQNHILIKNLLAKFNDKLSIVIGRLTAWSSRCSIPVGVDSTLNILQALFDIYNNEVTLSQQSKRLLLSMALVRFVNGMVDSSQQGTYAAPIVKLAEQIGLPRTLVDLRHDCTHESRLPSLDLLELSSLEALEWLHYNYWKPFNEINAEQSIKVFLKEYFEKPSKKKIKASANSEGIMFECISQFVWSRTDQNANIFARIIIEEYQDEDESNLIPLLAHVINEKGSVEFILRDFFLSCASEKINEKLLDALVKTIKEIEAKQTKTFSLPSALPLYCFNLEDILNFILKMFKKPFSLLSENGFLEFVDKFMICFDQRIQECNLFGLERQIKEFLKLKECKKEVETEESLSVKSYEEGICSSVDSSLEKVYLLLNQISSSSSRKMEEDKKIADLLQVEKEFNHSPCDENASAWQRVPTDWIPLPLGLYDESQNRITLLEQFEEYNK